MSATATATRTPARNRARVAVQFAIRSRRIPSTVLLRRWARAAARDTTQLVLRIVGSAEARRLNRIYRGRDYATDVLTFVYGNASPAPHRRRGRCGLAGDIVICHPVLVRAASERSLPLAAHYAHLVIHGVLHLHGHDHRGSKDAARMQRAEMRLLARLGFANPYAVESPQQARQSRRRGR